MLPGDVIVLGSDGLFDNMWNFELEAIISEHLKVSLHLFAFQHLRFRDDFAPSNRLGSSVYQSTAMQVWSQTCSEVHFWMSGKEFVVIK